MPPLTQLVGCAKVTKDPAYSNEEHWTADMGAGGIYVSMVVIIGRHEMDSLYYEGNNLNLYVGDSPDYTLNTFLGNFLHFAEVVVNQQARYIIIRHTVSSWPYKISLKLVMALSEQQLQCTITSMAVEPTSESSFGSPFDF